MNTSQKLILLFLYLINAKLNMCPGNAYYILMYKETDDHTCSANLVLTNGCYRLLYRGTVEFSKLSKVLS